jgi:hypothetical protein
MTATHRTRSHGLGWESRPFRAEQSRPEKPPRSAQPVRPGWWVLVVVLLALLPLIGHGCHGDDVDHEPTVAPPVYNQD